VRGVGGKGRNYKKDRAQEGFFKALLISVVGPELICSGFGLFWPVGSACSEIIFPNPDFMI
jgi:hypothetical protein